MDRLPNELWVLILEPLIQDIPSLRCVSKYYRNQTDAVMLTHLYRRYVSTIHHRSHYPAYLQAIKIYLRLESIQDIEQLNRWCKVAIKFQLDELIRRLFAIGRPMQPMDSFWLDQISHAAEHHQILRLVMDLCPETFNRTYYLNWLVQESSLFCYHVSQRFLRNLTLRSYRYLVTTFSLPSLENTFTLIRDLVRYTEIRQSNHLQLVGYLVRHTTFDWSEREADHYAVIRKHDIITNLIQSLANQKRCEEITFICEKFKINQPRDIITIVVISFHPEVVEYFMTKYNYKPTKDELLGWMSKLLHKLHHHLEYQIMCDYLTQQYITMDEIYDDMFDRHVCVGLHYLSDNAIRYLLMDHSTYLQEKHLVWFFERIDYGDYWVPYIKYIVQHHADKITPRVISEMPKRKEYCDPQIKQILAPYYRLT